MIELYDVSWWDRLLAAARGDGGAVASWLWWSLPVLLAGVLALTVLAWRVARRVERARKRAAAFYTQGRAIGLEPAECTLLHTMATEAALATPMAIFTWDRAFEDGVTALMRSRRMEHTTAEDRRHIDVAIEHLRNKLGLRQNVAPVPAVTAVACTDSLGTFARDDDASANRRRYRRVATRRPCRIAPFAFETGSAMDAPEFVQATLVEIGGTGLKVNAHFAPAAGDRVMVVTQLDDGRAVQGLARVRRVGSALAGAMDIALEMIGLHPAEVAVLAKETQTAATSH